MGIRAKATAEPKVTWEGSTILWEEKSCSISQMQTMMHSWVAKARHILMTELMMIDVDSTGEVNEGQVPPIDWSQVYDNMAETRVGWSFLDDSRSRFSVDGQWWLWNRVFQQAHLRRRFVAAEQADGQVEWRNKKNPAYGRV